MGEDGAMDQARPSEEGREKGVILVVDDQRNMRATTALLLRADGYDTLEAGSAEEAAALVVERTVDVVVTDLKMEPIDGLELLRRVRALSPATQVIVMTAFGTVASAVDAMRVGAFDYIAKPFREPELLIRVANAMERRRLLAQVDLYARDFERRHGLESIVGRSAVMTRLGTQIARAAISDATVLVAGESGVGKELVARALHTLSKRTSNPFVAVNCAALTETLLDSELFGHAKGAFTGAIKARRGLFEEADGGTLFIDEVTETTLAFQAKLLRAIQERTIRRVGETNSVPIDVRLVAATNQDLRQAVAEKRFREDLYYRLNVVPLHVPPLRERAEDIPLLARHFLDRFNRRQGEARTLSEEALAFLSSCPWPGNVRELENAVERAAALSEQQQLSPTDFAAGTGEPGGAERPRSPTPDATIACTLQEALDRAELAALDAALRESPGDLGEVARRLGISSTTLWRKMKRHALSR